MALGSLTFCGSLKRETVAPGQISSWSVYLRPTIKVSSFTPNMLSGSSSSSCTGSTPSSEGEDDDDGAVAIAAASSRSTSLSWLSANGDRSSHAPSRTCGASSLLAWLLLGGRVKFNWRRVRWVSLRFRVRCVSSLPLGWERHESGSRNWHESRALKQHT